MKYKQLIVGVILGAIFTATVSFASSVLTAQIADFPILVNGKTVTLDIPAVTINDRTYLPLRAMGNVLGVKVDWNADKGQAEINSIGKSDDVLPSTAPKFYETSGHAYMIMDNKLFVDIPGACEMVIAKNSKCRIDFTSAGIPYLHTTDTNQVLLEHIETVTVNDRMFIDCTYFQTTVLTLVK